MAPYASASSLNSSTVPHMTPQSSHTRCPSSFFDSSVDPHSTHSLAALASISPLPVNVHLFFARKATDQRAAQRAVEPGEEGGRHGLEPAFGQQSRVPQ